MTDNLLRCPFCGDKDDFNPSVSKTHGYKYPGTRREELVHKGWYVECDKCAGCGPCNDKPTDAGKAEAITAWNTRSLNDEGVRELVIAANGLLAVSEMTTFSDQYPAECARLSAALDQLP